MYNTFTIGFIMNNKIYIVDEFDKKHKTNKKKIEKYLHPFKKSVILIYLYRYASMKQSENIRILFQFFIAIQSFKILT